MSFVKSVKILSPADFNSIESWKLKKQKCMIILFYVDWCPHCVKTKPLWNELATMNAFFDVAAFDCQKYSKHVEKMKQDTRREIISGYPSIVVYQNGEPKHVFKGERNLKNLMDVCMEVCN